MSRETYADPRWQTVRRAVLERDLWRCQIQRAKCTTKATEVDHIVAVSQGGAKFDPANLRAACKSCNIGERNAQVAARARGGAPATATAAPHSRECRVHGTACLARGGPHSRPWSTDDEAFYYERTGRLWYDDNPEALKHMHPGFVPWTPGRG
jgi:hypothetical protein